MEKIVQICLLCIGALIAIGLFAILVVLNNIAKQLKEKNSKQLSEKSANLVAPTPVAVLQTKPANEEVVVTDDTVTFSSEKALTIDDKYVELSTEQKNYYDQIVEYASKVEGSRRFKNARYEEHKVGKNRLVRMLIKRGQIVCEFILPNNDFKNYVSENKLKIKSAPTVLKIADESSVQIAKDSIDIAVKAIAEEKEIKRQQTRERRKQARIAKQS